MSIKLGTNIAALRTMRQLGTAEAELRTVFDRLATGARINRASDDPAGLSLGESLNVRSRLYGQAVRNINDGIALLSVYDGALEALGDIISRQKELAAQAANGVYSREQRKALNNEANALSKEYNRIIESTTFNDKRLFNTENTSIVIQAGVGSNDTVSFDLTSDLSRPVGTGTVTLTQTLSSGAFPAGGSFGDVNGDGIGDLLVMAAAPGDLEVYLSNGDGTFQAAQSFTMASDTRSITSGDVNGDGILDVIGSTYGADQILVTLGNGDGTFRARTVFSVGDAPEEVALGDFDGDGIIDAAVANFGGASDGISLLVGNGDGTFQSGTAVGAGGRFRSIQAGDLDGDGDLDFVTSDAFTNQVEVFFNDGAGGYSAAGTYSSPLAPQAVRLGDLNGDSYLDIVTANYDGNGTILLANGDGTFLAATEYDSSHQAVALELVDMNLDGYLDIVDSTRTAGDVNTYFGNGDGTFGAKISSTVGSSVVDIAVGDFDGDGVPDTLAVNNSASSGSIAIANTVQSVTLPAIDILTVENARAELDTLDGFTDRIQSERAHIGAEMSRLTTALQTAGNARVLHQEAAGRILDADVAEEAAHLIRLQILRQAGGAVLSQANFQNQIALSLLKG